MDDLVSGCPLRNKTERINDPSLRNKNTSLRKRPIAGAASSDNEPHPLLERTVLRTAEDYSKMLESMFPDSKEADHGLVIQKKNLTTLMEELWLNASWALMTLPDYWYVTRFGHYKFLH
jgi:hypothetical protein